MTHDDATDPRRVPDPAAAPSGLRGRGYAEGASILGAHYSGILAPDGWAPYQRFERAPLQTCNAHLLRRCREILQAATRGAVRFPRGVKKILQHETALRDRPGGAPDQRARAQGGQGPLQR